ncbi:MAG: 3-hydroxyacyl-CoA dehydrogenase family protein [Paracoccaceae bacterium]|nr:3-hydroxyacyl-CoA dehydrogenase family protein [Paracoccaceae bacterium]
MLARSLAEVGFSKPEDIDKTVSDELGLCWSFMGLFEMFDLNAPAGFADYTKRYGPMYMNMARNQMEVLD